MPFQNMRLNDSVYLHPNFSILLNLTDQEIHDILHGGQNFVVSRHQIWPYFFWFTFALGMVGNWLVVYILLRKKNLRTVTNLYLLNLAVGDIVYLVTTLPHTIYWTDMWPIGQAMCTIIHYMMGVSMTVTVLSLTAVGLDRHYAILYPVSSRQHRTLQKTSTMIGSFWIFSFLISSPSFVIARKVDVITGTICLNYWYLPWAHRAHSLSIFLLLYLIPQGILAVCYTRIGKRLWFSMRLHEKDSARSVHTLRTRRRVVKMVIIATICFAICWLPVHLVELAMAYGRLSDLMHEMKLLAPLIPHVFIATNPIMYCFMSNTFLMSFKNAFQCNTKLLNNSAIVDRTRTSSRKHDRSWPNRDVSEYSNEESIREDNVGIISVDKSVNTSPKLSAQRPLQSDATCSTTMEFQDFEATPVRLITRSSFQTSSNL